MIALNNKQTGFAKAVLFAVATVVLTPTFSVAAADHDSRASCHAYIFAQCNPNGQNICDADDYNWGYNECDKYYPSIGVAPPKPAIGNFKANPEKSRGARSLIKRSFRAK